MEQKLVWAVTSLLSPTRPEDGSQTQEEHRTVFTHQTLSISTYFEMLKKKKKRFWEERERKQEGDVAAAFLPG